MFSVTSPVYQTFPHLEDVIDFAETEQKSIEYISMNQACEDPFHEDQFIQLSDGSQFQFNRAGFGALCKFLKLPIGILTTKTSKPGLASDILNDRCGQEEIHKQMATRQLVVNTENQEVCGVVSNEYVAYSNQDFLKDIFEYPQFMGVRIGEEDSKFKFKSALAYNTGFYLQLLSKHLTTTLEGREGKPDVTHLGLQISNGMAGDRAVRFDYFLERMVCANGLIVPTSENVSRVFHKGHVKNFQIRLHHRINNVFGEINHAKRMIQSIGNMPFNSQRLAELGAAPMIFDLVPGTHEKTGRQRGRDSLIVEAQNIEKIPHWYGGPHSDKVFKSTYRKTASMFDYVQVFTEEAKQHKAHIRHEIETKTGNFTQWIVKNEKRLRSKEVVEEEIM